MKTIAKILVFTTLLLSLAGCSADSSAQIAATTAPVWQFTTALCEGTPLAVSRIVTESVSCLHDYTLTVGQMKMVESAELIVISGAGLEDFMSDVLAGRTVVDASKNIPLLEAGSHHDHAEEEDDHGHDHDHDHEHDAHIWLSPANAITMAQNICQGLSAQYPAYAETFAANLDPLMVQLQKLQAYGEETLAQLSCRDLITFHDGFAYLAEGFDLEILEAIEEESGSEASAEELIHLIEEVRHHDLPAVFTEINGSASAASVICAETGVESFALDMAMGGKDYFASMYHNIDTLKEALE